MNGAAGRATSTRTFYEINPSGFSTFDGNAAETLVAERKGIVVGAYEVPIVQLADAWRASFGTRRPAVLSIDTEGFEEEALAGADLDALAPEVILVELKMATETAERTSLISLLRSEGFELAATFGVNRAIRPSLNDLRAPDEFRTRRRPFIELASPTAHRFRCTILLGAR